MNVHDFKVNKKNGEEVCLRDYKDKVLLIVNTASKCGFTSQYAELEKLYIQYHDQGLVILAIPSNQSAGQEPGSDTEIQNFCQVNYGVTFPVLAKSEVRGENAQPLYKYLISQKGFAGLEFLGEKLEGFLKNNLPEFLVGDEVKWNFTKFLVDKNGNVVQRYESMVNPLDIAPDIEKLL